MQTVKGATHCNSSKLQLPRCPTLLLLVTLVILLLPLLLPVS
jgi:hypothetical protein